VLSVAVGCVLAFLLGGVPWAFVLVQWLKGVDVRTVGSGNVGATNASRAFAAGAPRITAFVGIYLLDAVKGFAPAFWGPALVGGDQPILVAVLLGASAVLGHVFTPFLGFRGGKGVATATGVLLALDWPATTVALVVFFVVRYTTGQVFFGSLAIGLTFAGMAIGLHADSAFGARLPITVLALVLAGFLFWTHRSNLRKHFAARGAAST